MIPVSPLGENYVFLLQKMCCFCGWETTAWFARDPSRGYCGRCGTWLRERSGGRTKPTARGPKWFMQIVLDELKGLNSPLSAEIAWATVTPIEDLVE